MHRSTWIMEVVMIYLHYGQCTTLSCECPVSSTSSEGCRLLHPDCPTSTGDLAGSSWWLHHCNDKTSEAYGLKDERWKKWFILALCQALSLWVDIWLLYFFRLNESTHGCRDWCSKKGPALHYTYWKNWRTFLLWHNRSKTLADSLCWDLGKASLETFLTSWSSRLLRCDALSHWHRTEHLQRGRKIGSQRSNKGWREILANQQGQPRNASKNQQ